jgi:hypothetical protein
VPFRLKFIRQVMVQRVIGYSELTRMALVTELHHERIIAIGDAKSWLLLRPMSPPELLGMAHLGACDPRSKAMRATPTDPLKGT